jgi:hypothetical protein
MYDQFKDRVPAEGSAIDLMVRARAKGEPVTTHHMVANSYSAILAGGWRRRGWAAREAARILDAASAFRLACTADAWRFEAEGGPPTLSLASVCQFPRPLLWPTPMPPLAHSPPQATTPPASR